MADLFNEKAKEWDANAMIQALSSAVGSAMVEKIPLNADMLVMDFGAGTGLISSQIAPLVKKVVAVDTSEAMLGKLAEKPELKGRVEIVCRDITKTPMEDRFDLIMSAMAMHHVKDTPGLIGSFAQHLNEGGLVALADLDSEDGSFHPEEIEGVFHQGFDRNELHAILEENGFSDVRFFTAHRVEKEEKSYPVFLVTAKK